ncbi:MAG: PilW family protein [Gammaproteobacteria bacterium]|nr:PilW family protein [Gammaproteobacteria bacterium]
MLRPKNTLAPSIRAGQCGMTLIELLVSLVLGSILLISAISVFQGNRQTYRVAEGLAQVQENGRSAMQVITRDLRMIGQIGCGSRRVMLNDALVYQFRSSVDAGSQPPDFDPTFAASNPVQVFDNTEDWNGPETPTDGGEDVTVCDADGAGGACLVSDAISVVRGSETYALTLANMASAAGAIPVRSTEFATFNGDDDLFLITDCLRGDLFRGTAAVAGSTTNITPDAPLQQAYGQSSMIMPLTGSIYFVALSPSGDPMLYRLPLSDNGAFPDALPIATGVEGMQIMLGEDTNDDSFADVYRDPANVENWNDVTTVRISLLIRSNADNVVDVAAPINFFDGTSAAGVPGTVAVNTGEAADRRLRLTYTTTVTLRNHMP